jgi:hypothetical protein
MISRDSWLGQDLLDSHILERVVLLPNFFFLFPCQYSQSLQTYCLLNVLLHARSCDAILLVARVDEDAFHVSLLVMKWQGFRNPWFDMTMC